MNASNPAAAPLIVTLRMVTEADFEPVYRLLSDMNVIRYMLFPLHTPEDARRYVTEPRPYVLGPGRYAVDRAIVLAGSDEAIGLCGLVIDQEREEAEAWYMLLPEFWGKGLATSAVDRLLAIAFEGYRLHRVWACVVPANTASWRALEKAGLRREGHSRSSLLIHGAWYDSYLYAMLQQEWVDAHGPVDCSSTPA